MNEEHFYYLRNVEINPKVTMTSCRGGYQKLMELTYQCDFEQQIRLAQVLLCKIGEYIFEHCLLARIRITSLLSTSSFNNK